MKLKFYLYFFLITFLYSTDTFAQESKDEKVTAAANATNPLAYVTKLQFQPNFAFIDGGGRQLTFISRILRPSKSLGLPFIKSKNPDKVYTLYRLEVPLISQTFEKSPRLNATGIGDIILLDAVTFKNPWGQIGVGPGFLIPAASPEILGVGKWCTGPIVVVLYTKIKKLQCGALSQQFFSYAGPSDRPDQNFMYFQPIITKIFNKGYFIQTFPIMKFDWKNDTYHVPVNLMFGKAFDKDRSMFIGPQYVLSGPLKNSWVIQFNVNTMF